MPSLESSVWYNGGTKDRGCAIMSLSSNSSDEALIPDGPVTFGVTTLVKRVLYWWDAHFLGLEFTVSVITTFGVCAWLEICGPVRYLDDANTLGVYRALNLVGIAMAGFAMTVGSLVLTRVGAGERHERLRASRHFPALRQTYVQAVAFAGGLVLFSIIAMPVDTDKEAPPPTWLVGILLFFILASLDRVARAVWVLNKLLKADEPTRLDQYLTR